MATTRIRGFGIEPRRCEGASEDSERRFLSIYDVAAYCGVLPDDVLDWIEDGRLEASHIQPHRYRVLFNDLLVLLQKSPGVLEQPRYRNQ